MEVKNQEKLEKILASVAETSANVAPLTYEADKDPIVTDIEPLRTDAFGRKIFVVKDKEIPVRLKRGALSDKATYNLYPAKYLRDIPVERRDKTKTVIKAGTELLVAA